MKTFIISFAEYEKIHYVRQAIEGMQVTGDKRDLFRQKMALIESINQYIVNCENKAFTSFVVIRPTTDFAEENPSDPDCSQEFLDNEFLFLIS